jgi:hypothetical protein
MVVARLHNFGAIFAEVNYLRVYQMDFSKMKKAKSTTNKCLAQKDII